MHNKIVVCLCLCVFTCWQTQAQEDTLSMELKEISVFGTVLEKYISGAKILRIDSALLSLAPSKNLGELLMEQSPVYIKQYGNAMLGSISFRGSGAAHTALLWNGININSLTLGESDFSNIPVQVFDQISLQFGSAATLYGSDAIGGNVLLNTTPDWQKGIQVSAFQEAGSFGLFSSGIQTSVGNKNWQSRTKLYRFQLENDFPFINRAIAGFPLERQKNANVLSLGALQELSYRFRSGSYLSLQAWYHQRDSQHQPLMGANYDLASYSFASENNLRMLADFHHQASWGYLNLKSGWIKDDYLYNGGSFTSANRLIQSLRYEKKITEKISTQLGGQWLYVAANVDNYEKKQTEQRVDLFALFFYQPLSFWKISLNARQAVVEGKFAPFAPSLGSEWILLKQKAHQLNAKMLLSRSYRVPTLNERFWSPGGNPDIRPEQGLSTEAGLQWEWNLPHSNLNTELTFFRLWIDDWILWQPMGSFWSPINIRSVHSQGAEISLKWICEGVNIRWMGGIQASLIQSLNKSVSLTNDAQTIGKQLPYTPLFRSGAFAGLNYKLWYARLNFNYTGSRFTLLDNTDLLEGFGLLNLSGGKEFVWKKHRLSCSFRVNNLLNKEYQNLRFRAMPLRNYQLSLAYHLKT